MILVVVNSVSAMMQILNVKCQDRAEEYVSEQYSFLSNCRSFCETQQP